MQTIPRPEYPRPQFVRPSWMNLNGTWQFEIDHGASGRARGMVEKPVYEKSILVPFCPESRLSGIGNTDFMAAVWYRRTFVLPEEAEGQRVLLHFGAVDYACEAWVNGRSVGVHKGGYASFAFEITDALQPGENTLVVCAQDDTRCEVQPTGKQTIVYQSRGCRYTRTTGIWQTVWLEWVSETYISKVKLIPDAANGSIHIEAHVDGPTAGMTLAAHASFHDREQALAQYAVDGKCVRMALKMKDVHLWNVGEPNLYDLKLTLRRDGADVDALDSYFGLRTISFDGKKCLINGRPVFQRLILDQGYFPDGIYTAPTDEALRHDIELGLAMGFNGARMHQKVFEARYLYWADHMGYILWGEMASWGVDVSLPSGLGIFMREWLEVVDRDFSAPSIVTWSPFNECWCESGAGLRDLSMQMIYRVTKAVDPTRPVIDTSGGYHVETDIYDTHDYEQQPEVFMERYKPGAELYDRLGHIQHYDGKQPMLLSEYGGIRWTDDESGWGYGNAPATEEEFIERYRVLTETLLANPEHFGFCYTQLTDVEREQNGLYTYQRVPKFDPEVIAKITRQKAAIEE